MMMILDDMSTTVCLLPYSMTFFFFFFIFLFFYFFFFFFSFRSFFHSFFLVFARRVLREIIVTVHSKY